MNKETIQGSLNVKGLTKFKGGLTLEGGAITLLTTIIIPTINQLDLELETLQNALAVQNIGQELINPHS